MKSKVAFIMICTLMIGAIIYIGAYFDRDVKKPIDMVQTPLVLESDKYSENKVEQAVRNALKLKNVSSENLVNFWKNNMPLTATEQLFLLQEQAQLFIDIFEADAKNGDALASYLINQIKLTCQYNKGSHENIPSNKHNLALNINSYCDGYLSCCQDELEISELHFESNSAAKQLFFANRGMKLESALDLIEIDANGLVNTGNYENLINEISESRREFYLSLPLSNKLLLNQAGQLDFSSKLIFEEIVRVDSAAKLNVVWNTLSKLSLDDSPTLRKEMAAWLVTVCSSGYPCDSNQFLNNGLNIFCNNSFGCASEDRSVESVVKKYAGNEHYQEIMSRAWQISNRIGRGQQEQLLCELISSFEEGKQVCK